MAITLQRRGMQADVQHHDQAHLHVFRSGLTPVPEPRPQWIDEYKDEWDAYIEYQFALFEEQERWKAAAAEPRLASPVQVEELVLPSIEIKSELSPSPDLEFVMEKRARNPERTNREISNTPQPTFRRTPTPYPRRAFKRAPTPYPRTARRQFRRTPRSYPRMARRPFRRTPTPYPKLRRRAFLERIRRRRAAKLAMTVPESRPKIYLWLRRQTVHAPWKFFPRPPLKLRLRRPDADADWTLNRD